MYKKSKNIETPSNVKLGFKYTLKFNKKMIWKFG